MSSTDELVAFLDITDLCLYSHRVPDVSITAGFVLDNAIRPALASEIARVKGCILGRDHLPVKWNLRDDAVLQAIGQAELDVSSVLGVSREIRSDLLKLLSSHGAVVFASILEAYSDRRPILKRTRRPRLGYGFSNLLMRLGLYVKNDRPITGLQVVLDWPEGNEPRPFADEYTAAWRDGLSAGSDPPNEYYCGALRTIGFHQGLHFSKTEMDAELQLADLIVGCTRDFISRVVKFDSGTDFGADCFRSIVHPMLHRSSNDEVLGYGLIVSPTASDLATTVAAALREITAPTALAQRFVAENPSDTDWFDW